MKPRLHSSCIRTLLWQADKKADHPRGQKQEDVDGVPLDSEEIDGAPLSDSEDLDGSCYDCHLAFVLTD